MLQGRARRRPTTAQSSSLKRFASTYDGMAIARAVLEYCADKRRLGAKTLFSTHYHELTDLEGSVPGVRNYYITARKQGLTVDVPVTSFQLLD